MGEEYIKEMASRQNISICEAVYGVEHVKEEHRSHEYKFKYLKTYEPETGLIYAFPDGLPEFKGEKRIHFIGHSMGVLTVRLFQHYLETGYFDKIAGRNVEDRSS